MDFEISISDFRGFHNQPWTAVKPLTLLVGENSAGKTSFLAALKYATAFASGQSEVSFNNDPFQLGTFDQISHYRLGKTGRAKSFMISVRKKLSPDQVDGVNTDAPITVEMRLTFTSQESNATISELEFRIRRASLQVKLVNGRDNWMFTNARGDQLEMSNSSRFFSPLGGGGIRYIGMMLHEARRTGKSRNQEAPTELAEQATQFASLIEDFINSMGEPVYAISAIRTKPLRTYTPGLDTEDSEGSHVPFELARLSRMRNKTSWEDIRGQLLKFGQSSDMFNDLEVKSFGKSASDPFQLQLSYSGPKRNIVDLGYGTSQVLPILYYSARGSEEATFLIQQPEVHLHPRAQAALGEFFVDAYTGKSQEFVLETHSDFLVDRIRASVRARRISNEDVSLLFFERSKLENRITRVKLGEIGEPLDPPPAYRTFFLEEEFRQLGLDVDAISD